MGKLGFEPADEAGGVKPQLNAGSSPFRAGQLTWKEDVL